MNEVWDKLGRNEDVTADPDDGCCCCCCLSEGGWVAVGEDGWLAEGVFDGLVGWDEEEEEEEVGAPRCRESCPFDDPRR